ncbi:hypothetical protein DL769_005602 [Monosporascus sp. CRB-8-3]|nr:hypothetical protein DL769_005602 [Monosporascus sp. CRB-8-3]
MVTGKGTASGKDVGGQPEGFDMEQLMKVFAKLSSESATKKKDTHLDWKYFDFKLSEKNRLRSNDNWEMWKTAVWVALIAVGYRDGDSAKLSHIDKAKLAAAVVANVKKAPMAVVIGLTKGTTEMIKVYNDFVVEFREKDLKKGSGNSYNANQNRQNKPLWNKDGQLLCYNCGEYGHMAKDCPKRRNDGLDERSKRGGECEASFIPEGLQDLYRTDGKIF